ncbi:MCE family protein [Nocardia bovistercoris]|uniref:MCE family protein n=1 Tax=Nocardia bovistercoris TaxID=2785916 RepID=A0A931IGR4_9NOCA|nr:MCE family protein [Nocardia bovistercoris]MBH0781124.1 MCE family protein [Nocardia bovistercoris]
MKSRDTPLLKFGAFAVVMVVLSGFLILVFGQYRTGDTVGYSAVFADSSGLRKGDTVRIAGVQVGKVRGIELRDDHRVLVDFDADRSVAMTTGTKVSVRYLNLVGDRYLELTDEAGDGGILPEGARIPLERTASALDLDLLLGGLKPVIQGLNAREVNSLTWSLLEIVQGKQGTINSLFARTASFTSALANNNEVVQNLIDHLNTVMRTLSEDGAQFSETIGRLEQLVTELAGERDPIGAAVDSLDVGTATIADLLTTARPPLAGTIEQLSRLAPLIDDDKATLDAALQRAPENFRKLVRTGAYGNFVQYYICALSVRLNDPSGEVIELPAIEQKTGRCSP